MDAFDERAGPNTTPVADTRGRSPGFEFCKISTACQRPLCQSPASELLAHPRGHRRGQASRSLTRPCAERKLGLTHELVEVDSSMSYLCVSLARKWSAAMTIYGYARVSTEGQTLAGQEAQLAEAGAAKVFSEKISGASNQFGFLLA